MGKPLIENVNRGYEDESTDRWILENLSDKKEQEICKYILMGEPLNKSVKQEILYKYNMTKEELDKFLERLIKEIERSQNV